MLKVIVSCYSALALQQRLQKSPEIPSRAIISTVTIVWAVTSLMLSFMKPLMQLHGFFADWDGTTMLVAVSFLGKIATTMCVLQMFGPLQKNMGEAVAVIAINVFQAAYPGWIETNSLVMGFVVGYFKIFASERGFIPR